MIGIAVAVERDARVGGGEHAVRRVERLGKLVEGDVAGPLMRRGIGRGGVGGNGRERAGIVGVAAKRDAADGVVADVALVVGVHQVLRGSPQLENALSMEVQSLAESTAKNGAVTLAGS